MSLALRAGGTAAPLSNRSGCRLDSNQLARQTKRSCLSIRKLAERGASLRAEQCSALRKSFLATNLVISNAVEMLVRAQEDLAVRNSWSSVARFPQIIRRQKLELFRVGPKD